MLGLTGPRVQAGLAGRYRELEIDRKTITRAMTIFERQLSGARSLTRAELGQALVAADIAPDGQRLPHLLLAAELEGLIVSGPRRGKQHTWALFEERVPQARTLERDEAVTELASRYFRSHGAAPGLCLVVRPHSVRCAARSRDGGARHYSAHDRR